MHKPEPTILLIEQDVLFEMGPRMGRVLTKLAKGIEHMAENFDRLSAAVDSVADRVEEVAAAIRNPASDNNNQATIDDLAGRLEGAADSLRAATADENAEDAGPALPGGDNNPSPEPGTPAEELPAPNTEGSEGSPA